MQFFEELKRRKVFRVAIVYVASAFAILEAAELILPRLGVPDSAMTALVIAALFGFPIALVLSWVLELTPQGLRRTTAELDARHPAPALLDRRTIMVASALVVLGFGLGAGLTLLQRKSAAANDGADNASRSVAVLPFADLSEGANQKWFADGVSEEILTSLARVPELRVIGRSSSFLFKSGTYDDRVIADSLGAAHLLKGSVQRVGERLRVRAQLVRAADGVQLWSDSYDRDAADLLAVQREVAEKVANALDVLLDDEQRERMFAAGTHNVEAFEAYLRGRDLFAQAHQAAPAPATLADAEPFLQRAMELDPGFAAAAFLHADRYGHYVADGPASRFVGPIDLTVQQGLERLRADFTQAAAARDPQARLLAQINLAFFSSNWRGMPALLDQLERQRAMLTLDDPWGRHVPLVLGRFDLVRRLAIASTRWDRLNALGWDQRIMVELAAGDLHAARAQLAEARKAWPQYTGQNFERIIAILAQDRAALPGLLNRVDERNGYAEAVSGDTAGALAKARAYEQAEKWPDTRLLLVYHELGRRELSRDLAARIDAMPAGPAMLLRELSLTGAALTFDPADTPNFSARMREAGVDPATLRRMPRLGDPRTAAK